MRLLSRLLTFCLLPASQLCCISEGKAQPDSVQLFHTIEQARSLFTEDPRQSIALSESTLRQAREHHLQRLSARALNTIGSAYYFLSIYDSAEFYHLQALEIQKAIRDPEGTGRSYTNLGSICSDRGLNDQAIRYFIMAEEQFERAGYREGMAKLNNSLGILFFNIRDYTNAIKYYRQGVAIAAEFSDKSLYHAININLANALGDAGDLKASLDMYKASYGIAKSGQHLSHLLVACNNICLLYLTPGPDHLYNLDSARKYDHEAMTILGRLGMNISYKSLTYTNHASILNEDRRYKEAIPYLDTAILIAREFKDLQKQVSLYHELSQIHKKNYNLPEALAALHMATNLKDSLYLHHLDEKLSEINTVHQVEKKEAEITRLQSEKHYQRRVNLLLISVVGLTLISLIIAIYNYIRKRKDNRIISLQKQEVEAKNMIIGHKQTEIIDSINYAKRLQEAILPAMSYFRKHLPESFILYQPKDIVAGDFYWMETQSSPGGEKLVLFAAGDATGHGVPGALVSVVCSNALNRSILEFGLSEPGAILDKTRELVIHTFEKSVSDVKDGMDISLCCLNPNTRELLWAGANNPLWLIRGGELQEIRADKQPVGKQENPLPFTTHRFLLKEGDMIYLLTDGYADQFGGPAGKKFKYKPLKTLLSGLSARPVDQQKQMLLETLLGWKGDIEQVDDICIIGVCL